MTEKTVSSVESKIDLSAKEVKPEFNSGKFVTLNKYFQVEEGLYAVMKRNLTRSVNTLLLGPTGVGKTELVANLASSLGLSLTIFDMGTMTDPIMSLVGNHIISANDGQTTSRFVKSRFSEVIQQPGVVLLDELSRAGAQANNLLFPCLDFRRELPMEYCFEDTTPIKVHPQCVFVATANLGSQYTGTHKLDRALQDRFMCIQVDQLNTNQTINVIKMHAPSISALVVVEMVRVYSEINKMHDQFSISFNLSIRHLKMIADLVVDGFTLYDAFYIVCKGIGGTDGGESTLKPIFEPKSTSSDPIKIETPEDDDEDEEDED